MLQLAIYFTRETASLIIELMANPGALVYGLQNKKLEILNL
jgi:hypothetical protein